MWLIQTFQNSTVIDSTYSKIPTNPKEFLKECLVKQ